MPGHPAVPIRVVMKFIHDDIIDCGRGAFAQGNIRKNFGRATEDGRGAIDCRIAGAEADIIRSEFAAERQPFLVRQRFDGAGVNRLFTLSERLEMQGGGDERFSGTGGRIQDNILLFEQLQDSGFLTGIKL